MDIETDNEQGMARCEITNKLVPEDELVEIEGKRVCAEGKAKLLDALKSGKSLPGEMERPTVLRRFGCIFLDGIVVGVCGAIFGLVIGFSMFAVPSSTNLDKFYRMQGIAGLFGILITLFYFGVMHGMRGQTLGKMAGKLKVVNLDGSDIGMNKAFLRAVAYAGPQLINPFLLLAGLITVSQFFGIVIGIYGLTNVILALIDSKSQRALHDRLTGTRVIIVD